MQIQRTNVEANYSQSEWEKHLGVLTTWERKVQEIREDFQEVSRSSALGDHIRTFPVGI